MRRGINMDAIMSQIYPGRLSAMDAARQRAGLKPLKEAIAEDKAKAKQELRARYGRPPKGEWRKNQVQSERAFPGRVTDDFGTPRTVTGWVYIAGAYDRGKLVHVKIGYTGSKNPNTRVKGVAQGVPYEVRLMAAVPGSRALELLYHREFYKVSVKGEWFEPSPDLLLRVETLNAQRNSWKPWWGKKKPR